MPRAKRKSKAAHTPRIDKHEVYRLIDQGHTQGEVSRQLGCNQGYISSLLKARRLQGTGPAETPPQEPTPAPHIPQKLALASLCLDAGTQMRADDEPFVVADYAEAMADGAKFPPVIVFSDGAHCWLADGFQRVKAAETIGYAEIHAEIRPGTLRDAILFSCGANSTHGQRRTNADKRRAVNTVLDDAEWSQLYDRRIAELCGVTHPFVAKLKERQRKDANSHAVVIVTTNRHEVAAPTPPEVTAAPNDAPREGEEAVEAERSKPPAPNNAPEPPSLALPFPENGQPPLPPLPPNPTVYLRHLTVLTADALAQLARLGEAARVEGYPEYLDLQATLRALQHEMGVEVASREVHDA